MPQVSRHSSGAELKRRATRALGWSFAGIIGPQMLQFGFSVLLARLLVPADFGLIAMLGLFLALAQSMIDSGFGSALIQKQNATRVDESSVFFLNLGFGIIAYGLLWIGAPAIAAFYREPVLIPLSRLMGVSFIINAFGLVQISLLQKSLNFKALAKRSLVAALVSGPVGVILAVKGYGVWSLVAQAIAGNLAQTVLLWFWSDWRPALRFSRKALAGMFGYGSKLFISGILNTVFDNLYPMVIGRLFTKTDLGFYSHALKLQRLPVTTASGVIGQVAFPAFSSIQDDRQRLTSGYRKAIRIACYLVFPLMLGLIAISKPLFIALFTEKWAESVPYFRILCLSGMLYPLHSLNLNALKAVGRSDLFLRLEVLKKGLTIIVVLVTYPYGLTAMVWGQVANSFVALFVNTYYTTHFIEYPLREQARDILPYLTLSIAMGVVVHGVGLLISGWPVWQLLVQVPVGFGFYLVTSYLFRVSVLSEMTEHLTEYRASRHEKAGV